MTTPDQGSGTRPRVSDAVLGLVCRVIEGLADVPNDPDEPVLGQLLRDATLDLRDARAAHDKLVEALQLVASRWRRPDEGHSAYFERMAEAFYNKTGFIAPGKSVPLEMGGYDEDARQAQWVEFYDEPYRVMQAALASLLAQAPEKEKA